MAKKNMMKDCCGPDQATKDKILAIGGGKKMKMAPMKMKMKMKK